MVRNGKTTERKLGLGVMQILANRQEGKGSVRTLIKYVPDYVQLTDVDREPSTTRRGEEMWEQRVRNLKSHDKTAGNVLAEGFVKHVGRGVYQLTQAGWMHLEHKGLL